MQTIHINKDSQTHQAQAKQDSQAHHSLNIQAHQAQINALILELSK